MKLPKDKGRQLNPQDPRRCDICKKVKRTTRFRTSWHDFEERYAPKKLFVIHSDCYDLCKVCLYKLLKKINIKK